MKTINRDNYEVFIVDYLDGNLTTDQVAALLLFLEENKDLQQEFELFKDAETLATPSITLDTKRVIINSTVLSDETLLAFIQKELAPEEATTVLNALENDSEAQKRYATLKHTFLVADASIVYENKQQLKQVFVETDPSIVYAEKANLIGLTEEETELVALLENDLTLQEQIATRAKIQHNQSLQKMFALMQLTKLEADRAIIFEAKESLKKKAGKIIPFYYQWAAAASILLLIALTVLHKSEKINPSTNKPIAVLSIEKPTTTADYKASVSEHKEEKLASIITPAHKMEKAKVSIKRKATNTNSTVTRVEKEKQPSMLMATHSNKAKEPALIEPQLTTATEPVEEKLTTINAIDDTNDSKELALTTITANAPEKKKVGNKEENYKEENYMTLPKLAKRAYDNLTKDKIQIDSSNGISVETKLFAFSSK